MNRYNHDNEFKQLVDDLVHCKVYYNIFAKIQEYGLERLLEFFRFVGSIEDISERIHIVQPWDDTKIIDTIDGLINEIMYELADPRPLMFYFDSLMITQEQYKQALQTLTELGITKQRFTARTHYEFSPLGLAMLIFDDDYVKEMIKFYSEIYVNGYISKIWKINTLKSDKYSGVLEIDHVLLMEHRHLDQSINAYFSCKHEWLKNGLAEDYFISGQVD